MSSKLSNKTLNFLFEELCLNEASISLAIKISRKHNCPLPISMWSYGIINSEELDEFYTFLYQSK